MVDRVFPDNINSVTGVILDALARDREAGHGLPVVTLTGNNGSGKSYSLGALAHLWIGGAGDRAQSDPVPRLRNYENLLVVSNMVTDPFPFYAKQEPDGYNYLGLRSASNNIFLRGLERSSGEALATLTAHGISQQCVGVIAEAVQNVTPCLAVQRGLPVGAKVPFRGGKTLSSKVLDVIGGFAIRPEGVPKVLTLLDAGALRLDEVTGTDVPRLEAALDGWASYVREIMRNAHVRRDATILPKSMEVALFQEMDRTAISAGVGIKALIEAMSRFAGYNFTVIPRESRHGATSTESFSAGQLLYIGSLLRIASALRPRSLILIDEPEIGLHPAWQSEFIGRLKSLCSPVEGVAVVIATHSPFIVGDSDSVVRFDCPGECHLLHLEYKDLSIEEVVYQCFGTRVFSTREIEVSLNLVLDWLSHGEPTRPSADVLKAVSDLKRVSTRETSLLNQILGEYDARSKEVSDALTGQAAE